jgi:hypothetical protein
VRKSQIDLLTFNSSSLSINHNFTEMDLLIRIYYKW